MLMVLLYTPYSSRAESRMGSSWVSGLVSTSAWKAARFSWKMATALGKMSSTLLEMPVRPS